MSSNAHQNESADQDGNGGGDAQLVGIACGSSHSLALLTTPKGDITASWGRGEDGQLGHGDAEERLRPQAIFSLINRGISSVYCGAEYSVAVSTERREIYSWGWGDFGRLGHGDCKDAFIPTPIVSLSGKIVVSLACGDTHTLVATEEGEIFSFGRNQNGQLGFGTTTDSLVPKKVDALAGKQVLRVACGAEHSVCSTVEGEVYAWGWGRYGNLGDGGTEDRNVPTKVSSLEDIKVVSLACGWRHTCAVDSQGALWTWGWSKYGQLGHGDLCDQVLPKKLEALRERRITLVTGGWRHTLAIDEQGKLFAWGWNKFGQLGLGHNEDACSPQLVSALVGRVTQLASGWKHTLVVTDDGAFWGWGRGANGQLGLGTVSDTNMPRQVSLSMQELTKEAHPVVMYSVPPGDRYAVVPDNAAEMDASRSHAVPDAGQEGGLKRQKVQ